MDSIAQDIYYIKQTSSCAIFTATLLWNSAGHLLHKTNPNLSYFELSYVFWEHNDSVGRGTTVILNSASENIFTQLTLNYLQWDRLEQMPSETQFGEINKLQLCPGCGEDDGRSNDTLWAWNFDFVQKKPLHKSQKILKAIYGVLNSSKKRTKNNFPEHVLFRKYSG